MIFCTLLGCGGIACFHALTSRQYQGEDGREMALLKFYYDHHDVKDGLSKGNLDSVLRIPNRRVRQHRRGVSYLGREEGKFISDLLDNSSSPQSQSIIECGTHVGCSAIMVGVELKRRGGKHLFTFYLRTASGQSGTAQHFSFIAIELGALDLLQKIPTRQERFGIRRLRPKERVKSASAFGAALSSSHPMPYCNLQRHLLNDREGMA